MMYPFMTLNDDTEITHSVMKPDGKVKVYGHPSANATKVWITRSENACSAIIAPKYRIGRFVI